MASIGINVGNWRRRRGLSLSELARRTGTAKSWLSSIENGKGEPGAVLLYDLADALGCTVYDLLGRPELERTP